MDNEPLLGKQVRANIAKRFPALTKITKAAELRSKGFHPLAPGQFPPPQTPPDRLERFEGRMWIRKEAGGYLRSLTGRPIPVRKDNAVLNTLLQNAGAEIAKKWIVLADQTLRNMGLKHGWDGDYALLAFVHDEVQVAVREGLEERVREVVLGAATEAGRFFNIRCLIEADATIGNNWRETH